ncbi:MAG: PKD domain-containing protein [Chitinophagales bacterium]|nr:PKD domain-containing protein [Chitinophagales bacterium]OJV27588.1 MAG: hypothetical protein BGO32_03150 [Bacteroidetes bacterium 37-13]
MNIYLRFISLLFTTFIGVFVTKAQIGCQANFYTTLGNSGICHFTDSSQIDSSYVITDWQWDFGNGTASSTQNPTIVYSTPGIYNVCLKITSQITGTPNVCIDSICKSVIYTCPNSIWGSFSFNAEQQTVYFNSGYGSNSTPLTYEWNFGDSSQVSYQVNPKHIYAADGSYQVCATINSANGCSRTECKTVLVSSTNCNLAAAFSYSQPKNNILQLVPQTTGGDTSGNIYVWKIGNIPIGTTHNNSDTVIITVPDTIPDGNSQLCLNVFVPNSSCQDSICQPIAICKANGEFSYIAMASDTIQFHSVYPYSGYMHQWYANGVLFSTDVNPKFKFQSNYAGINVCHILTDSTNIACTDTFCNTLQTQTCMANAGFQFTLDTAGNKGVLHFYSLDTLADRNHFWNIGNYSNTSVNPTITLPAGTYQVCHRIAQKSNPACQDTFCQQITISLPPCNLTVSITQYTDTSNREWLEAVASGNSSYSYVWSNNAINKKINITGQYGIFCVTVTDAATNCTATNCYNAGSIPLTDTICGITFNDLNGNGVKDSSEPFIAASINIIGSNNFQTIVLSDSITGAWQAYLPSGTYEISSTVPRGIDEWITTIPISTNNHGGSHNSQYIITLNGGQNICGLTFGLQQYHYLVCGYIYADLNGSGKRDGNEPGISGQTVTMDNQTAHTDAFGYYVLNIRNISTLNCIPKTPYTGFIPTPLNYSPSANNISGRVFLGYDFGIYLDTGACDVAVDLLPLQEVVPGFGTWYAVKVSNIGNTIASGLLTLSLDTNLTFVYSNQQGVYNSSSHTVSWNLNNILPVGNKVVGSMLMTPTSLPIGSPIFTRAEFVTTSNCTETNLNNNIDTTHQTVVASYDPNDKHVSPEGNIANNGQELAYTIRFQNTGTAPAVNVVVLDTLDNNLDWSTFEFKNASHSCNIQQEGNLVSFRFSNIMLPDSLHNEAESHGFVSYKIKAQQNLPNNTPIHNRAAIYFDYNEAILTNTTVNTIDFALAVKNINRKQPTITISPNPFKTYTNILVNGAEASPIEIEVRDLTGRTVVKQISESNLIQLQTLNLASGMYVYEVKQNNGVIGTGKIIAQ